MQAIPPCTQVGIQTTSRQKHAEFPPSQGQLCIRFGVIDCYPDKTLSLDMDM